MTALVQHNPVQMESSLQNPEVLHTHTYTREDVKKHCDHSDCWIIVQEKVYDVTRFLEEHPGGADIILEYAGADASAAFFDKGHSPNAVSMLDDYYVGQLIQGLSRAEGTVRTCPDGT